MPLSPTAMSLTCLCVCARVREGACVHALACCRGVFSRGHRSPCEHVSTHEVPHGCVPVMVSVLIR